MGDPNYVVYGFLSGGSILTGLAGKIIWDWLKNNRGNNKKTFLTERDHENLCKIASLQHREFVTDQFKDLKENYLTPIFKDIFREFKNNK